jgi:signal transduction histidine kinase
MKRIVIAIFITSVLLFAVQAAAEEPAHEVTSAQIVTLVREACALLEKEGDKAIPEFRRNQSKWFYGETYLFIYDMDGTRVFHATEPETEGKNFMDFRDAYGKHIVKMALALTSGKTGEGWRHYMWAKPDSIFPEWKSAFLKRVTIPSGKTYIVGCGIYNMKMEKEFIVNAVNEAAALIEKEGPVAFDKIRDEAGPFLFLDTYIFVDRPDGVELVNPAFPSLEGRNLIDYKDASGKYLVKEYIDVAMKNGSGWVTYMWPKPGETKPSVKHTYVKKAVFGGETFIVGSGTYL